jgi:5-formyltetrahydrofolate cyclo-ligase
MTSQTIDVSLQKQALRKEAYAARKAANCSSANIAACGHLTEYILAQSDCKIVSGYMPIQTEIDPRPTLQSLYDNGRRICLPVIQGRGKPLIFREWEPGCAMIEGDFGALIPRGGDLIVPDLAIIPLVGFDATGARLGYGGGFYDRTLIKLRKEQRIVAVAIAFCGQELEKIPTNQYDQMMDAVVTEEGVRQFNVG